LEIFIIITTKNEFFNQKNEYPFRFFYRILPLFEKFVKNIRRGDIKMENQKETALQENKNRMCLCGWFALAHPVFQFKSI